MTETTEKPTGQTYRPQSELEWAGLRNLVARKSVQGTSPDEPFDPWGDATKGTGRSALITSEESPFEAVILEVIRRRIDNPGQRIRFYKPHRSLDPDKGRLAFEF